MILIEKIIAQIAADIKVKLPPILTAKGLTDFTKYAIGNPIEKQELAIYTKISGFTWPKQDASFIIQAQLPSVTETILNQYIDAINEYLRQFTPAIMGFPVFNYEMHITDNMRTYTTDVFWEITLDGMSDDCDMED